MQFKYKTAPHYRQALTTQRIMRDLVIGLLVVYAFALYRAATLGTEYLINAIVLMLSSVMTAILTEVVWAKVTKKKVVPYLKSSFGVVTAIIITLMVPVNTGVYALSVSTFVAIFFGKLVFGGFGQNIFNPAGVGRAIVFTSFANAVNADLVTSATPTSTIASSGWMMSGEGFATFLSDFGGLSNMLIGNYNGAMGETSALVILIVGAILAYREVLDWRVPATYLGVIFIGAYLVGLLNGLGLEYALFHVLTGGAVFGAVFMLTDPVTNPNTRAGRIVFAACAGFITMVIRLCGNLPEGVLFSILMCNILTPVIDKFFDGKQVDKEKRNNKLVPIFVGFVIVMIGALGFTLNSEKEYTSSLASYNTNNVISVNANAQNQGGK